LVGSAIVSDTDSSVDMAITPIRPTLGSNHARGRSHAAYQGRSTGASSVNNSSPQAQTAPWTSNHLPAARPPPRLTSQVVATRTTRVARRRNTTAKAAQNTNRTADSTPDATL